MCVSDALTVIHRGGIINYLLVVFRHHFTRITAKIRKLYNSWRGSSTMSRGGLLILDRGDIQVYGPNSMKGVLRLIVFKYRCSQRASPIISLNLHSKARVSVRLNTRKAKVFFTNNEFCLRCRGVIRRPSRALVRGVFRHLRPPWRYSRIG